MVKRATSLLCEMYKRDQIFCKEKCCAVKMNSFICLLCLTVVYCYGFDYGHKNIEVHDSIQ